MKRIFSLSLFPGDVTVGGFEVAGADPFQRLGHTASPFPHRQLG